MKNYLEIKFPEDLLGNTRHFKLKVWFHFLYFPFPKKSFLPVSVILVSHLIKIYILLTVNVLEKHCEISEKQPETSARKQETDQNLRLPAVSFQTLQLGWGKQRGVAYNSQHSAGFNTSEQESCCSLNFKPKQNRSVQQDPYGQNKQTHGEHRTSETFPPVRVEPTHGTQQWLKLNVNQLLVPRC